MMLQRQAHGYKKKNKRTNLPITQNEYVLKDGMSIVSKTDTKGRITYVNPYFVEVSGFSVEDLLGKAHNIVRHPDMPEEAFADLWATLKAGLPWDGLVKNRCKNGDFYWVMANVTPIFENGSVTGYMSVRTKPERAQIDAAGKLYAQFKQGKAKGLALRQGAVARTGLAGWAAKLRNMRLSVRIAICMSLIIGVLSALCRAALAARPSAATTAGVAGLGGFGVAVSLYFWGALMSTVVRPLRDATSAARAMAGGDLSRQFSAARAGDIGHLMRALQQTNVNLRAIISDVRANADSIAVGTHEIAEGNRDLAGRTESQAASLEETASSMEQFSSTIKQNASNARIRWPMSPARAALNWRDKSPPAIARAADVASRNGRTTVLIKAPQKYRLTATPKPTRPATPAVVAAEGRAASAARPRGESTPEDRRLQQ